MTLTLDLTLQPPPPPIVVPKPTAATRLTLTLIAHPTVPVAHVAFYTGATLVGKAAAAPYTCTWTTAQVGAIPLQMVGWDARNLIVCTAVQVLQVEVVAPPIPPSPGGLPRVEAASLAYVGAFSLPSGFGYADGALAFSSATGTLLMVGVGTVAEIAIPTALPAPHPSQLIRAQRLQVGDPTDGKLALLNPANTERKFLAGIVVDTTRLITAGASYYDGAGSQILSHFACGLDLTIPGDAIGPFEVRPPANLATTRHLSAGFVGGYMCPIPADWQGLLGGRVLTGQACLPIISRTSWGPSAFAFDPAQLGSVDPLACVPLLYYTDDHPTLGAYGGAPTPVMGCVGAGEVRGIVFPDGTRSILFFGRAGVGDWCYGEATSDPAKHKTPNPAAGPNEVWCCDLDQKEKGTHAYPYEYRVWAYDALDFVAVKEGKKQPWEILPYAYWALTFPYPAWHCEITGACYDPLMKRLFVSQAFGEADSPILHVYTLTV